VGTCKKGTQTRTCSATCAWDAWEACAGAVGPAPEVCGNGLDENCNGMADEGCACKAVAAGAGSSFAVTGTLAKLVADPARCLLYGLRTGTPAEVVVFDTAAKKELTRIALPQPATDLDVAPNGSRLIVAHDAVHQVSVIDPGLLAVVSTVPVASDPYVVEVDDAGRVYYAELDQWCDIRSVDPAVGISSDKLLGSWGAYAPDIELSADGGYLFVGEAGISGGNVTRYRVQGGAWVAEDKSKWDGGYGFPYPARHLFLSPGGQHLWYAGYQLDPKHLATVNGHTGERVLTEDRAGTFAVGTSSVWDAVLVRPVAKLAATASAAALASEDTELWTWDASTSRLSYVNAAELIGAAALGDRNLPAAPLSSYALTRLVADPVRPRLYGLDTTHGLVVAIDTGTLAPVGAIVVGATPSDLAVSASGAALYVGDLQANAVARIDLADFRFDRFIATPDVPYEVEALSGGRIATIDQDQWTSLTVLDETTGAVTFHGGSYFQGALAATADGKALFLGESALSGSNVFRFDVTGTAPSQVAKSTFSNGYGFPYPARSVLTAPDGRTVYYAGYVLDGTNLTALLYQQADPVRAITTDGLLATSATRVYKLADGSALGTLPVSGAVQAAGPDGKSVYVYTGTALTKVDLSGY
jgi:DNA-binding beta-propeller fold protein YncE